MTHTHTTDLTAAARRALHEAVDRALDVEEDLPVLLRVCQAINVDVSTVLERAEEITREAAVTLHHYSVAGTLAVCGQLADGVHHTTHDADVVRALADMIASPTGGEVCASCLAVANEEPAR